MLDPSQMTPEQLQAYRAMLGQLTGQNVPPGQMGIPGGSMSGGVPAPYQPPGVPNAQVAPQVAGPSAPPPEAPSAAAGALGGAPEGAGITAEEAAAKPGLIMRMLSSPVGRTLGGLGMAASALSNDPGHLDPAYDQKHGVASWDPLQAKYLNPSPSDTGITELAKSAGRGLTNMGNTAWDWATKTRGEKDAEKAAQAPKGSSPSATQDLHQPSIEQALGLEAPTGGGGQGSSTGAGPLAGSKFQSQGRGRNPVIDALEGNIMATAPKGYQGGSEEIANELKTAAYEKGIAANTPGLRPGMYGGLAGDAAQREVGAQYQMGQAALALAAQSRQSKWALDAAKQGTDMEKENQAEEDASMKIHANHGHFLIEQTTLGQDGKPMKTLMPLDDAYFGIKRGPNGGIDPHASVTVMGQKFSNLDKDPFAKEALLLGNIQKDGQLSDVMNMPEVSKKIHAATIEGTRSLVGLPGNATPEQIGAEVARQNIPKAAVSKAQVDAQRGMIFMMMQKDQGFKQKLINMQYDLHNNKGVPGGGTSIVDQPPATPEAAGPEAAASEPGEDTDYLTQLDNAKQGK